MCHKASKNLLRRGKNRSSVGCRVFLQHVALEPWLLLLLLERCFGGRFENFPHAVFRFRGTFNVSVSANSLGHRFAVFVFHDFHLILAVFATAVFIAQILLVTDENDWNVLTEMLHLIDIGKTKKIPTLFTLRSEWQLMNKPPVSISLECFRDCLWNRY